MDFPVTAEFVDTANAVQLAAEARGDSIEWPASFVCVDGAWVYRVDDVEHFVTDGDDGPVASSRPREGVLVDVPRVERALAAHAPLPAPTLEERVAALPDPTEDLAGFRAGLADLLRGT